jgi:hypothetical protein
MALHLSTLHRDSAKWPIANISASKMFAIATIAGSTLRSTEISAQFLLHLGA